ncbi:EamA family transporter RarD [Chelativorans sp. SCAU2101]|uniref:EamA family transporter RarD n=1 Tax=Chelativorans petroleitrophicus TaxID=2975484 RepID=A0A9X3B9T6_9HYPH|nr:EamA family transporter RarD [Chelativorans petroleitrophicus]MCT8990891.1 EamA family transporter RarD [Chelativorans petroleitrophicus]
MADTVPESRAEEESARGFLYALSAYLLWGVLPIYMKAVAHIPPAEVVAHRVLWSVPVAGLVLLSLRRTADIRRAFRSLRTLAMAALTAAIISANWATYVWAIAAEQTVEAALGYYINPLVSVCMGAVLLRERLSRIQLLAIGFAAAGVVVLTVEAGGLPWVSLMLAVSFAVYGFLRKTLPIGPSQGFFLEVLIISVPALVYILWLQWAGDGHFRLSQPRDVWLLVGCGPVTAIPLILYAFGAKLLRYVTIGIMQYVAPTLIFLIAVFVFREPFGSERLLAFALIWLALAIYTWPMLRTLWNRGER